MRRYMRASDLAAVSKGSFEEALQSAQRAVIEHERQMCESGSAAAAVAPVAVIATFEGRAVAADAAGAVRLYTLVDGRVTARTNYGGYRTLSESELSDERRSAVRRIAECVAAGAAASPDDVLLVMR